MKSPHRTIIRHGLILTMDPSLGDIVDGDVLLEDDKIVAIGREFTVSNAETIDATGMIVLPGFADTHRHSWQTQLRALGADWSFPEYISQLRGRIGPHYRPEDMYIANLLASVESLYSGITTLLDWNHIINTPEHADASYEGLLDGGIRGVLCYSTGNEGFERPGVLVDAVDARRMRDQYFSDNRFGRITMAYGPLGTELGGEETVLPDFAAARELGLRISVHVGFYGQWLHQVDYLAKHNLLGPDVTLLHCNATTDRELELVRNSGATISISPESEMHLGCGIPPTNRILHHGMRPSISSDVPSVMGTDMFGQMRTMLGVMRGVESNAYLGKDGESEAPDPRDIVRIDSHDILEFATLEGARANDFHDRLGSLTPGKQADLILVSTDAPTMFPVVNPAASLVLGASPADVDTVFVAGEIRKRGGKLVGFDLPAIRRQAEASKDYLLEKAGIDQSILLRKSTNQ
jgi:cytosine/adenosine deaminase-related metal-dependent hydrolase